MPQRKRDIQRRIDNLSNRRNAKGQAMSNEEVEDLKLKVRTLFQQSIAINELENDENIYDPFEDDSWVEDGLRNFGDKSLQWKTGADSKWRSLYRGDSKSSKKRHLREERELQKAALLCQPIKNFFQPVVEIEEEEEEENLHQESRRQWQAIRYDIDTITEIKDTILANSIKVYFVSIIQATTKVMHLMHFKQRI